MHFGKKTGKTLLKVITESWQILYTNQSMYKCLLALCVRLLSCSVESNSLRPNGL